MRGIARALPGCVAIAAAVVLGAFGAPPALAATAGPPTGVVASARDGQANVYFAAPSSDGGSPITQYTVTASPGGATASGTQSPVLISGLTDGIAYTFTVTAVNSSGPGIPSNPSLAVTPLAPPAAIVDPAIIGSAQVGQTLHATSGAWTESPQLSYQWLDCDEVSGTCSGVAGAATGADYTISPLDGGFSIAVVVTAVNLDNEFGSDSSSGTSIVAAQPGAPTVSTAPTLSAVAASNPVSATTGAWGGLPTAYAYQWYACSPGQGWCHPVTGLSSLLGSYSPTQDDAGDVLKVAVVATNGVGASVPAFSGASATISFPPPTISISSPSEGGEYNPSLPPAAIYTCTPAAGETIRSCVGTVTSGSTIPLSPGSHVFSVTATDSAGASVTRTVNYMVGGQPTITLTGPANGASYTRGSSLPVKVICTAFDGSSLPCAMQQAPRPPCRAQAALVGCTDGSSVAGPPELDTQEVGRHTLTITATDAFGESANLTLAYSVVAGPPSVTAAQDGHVVIARFSQSSSRWRMGTGTRFSFTPNEAAVVTFVFQRDLSGRKAGGRCVAPTPANLHGPACTRTQRVGSLRRFEPAGQDVVPFNGRLGGSALAPGLYTVLVSAVAIGHNSGLVFTSGPLSFTVLK